MLDANTLVYGILGHPVRHSFSPAIHNTGFKKLGLNAAYMAFDVPDQELESAVKGIKALGIQGASVTIPHKVAVMPYLDELEDIARLVGSVNLICRKGDRLIGSNTDAYGFFQALSQVTDINHKKIAVFGSGGAARAVCFALFYYAAPLKLSIFAREEDTQESLVLEEHLSLKLREIDKLSPEQTVKAYHNEQWASQMHDYDILINTTPCGMHPLEHLSVLEAAHIPQGKVVMDIVYTPRETLFLRHAASRGCQLAYGIDMLLYQGLKQFEMWTGKPAPEQEMRAALMERLGL